MFGQRLLILLAVLMGLTLLASAVAPRQPAPRTAAKPAVSAEATAAQEPVAEIVDAGSPEPARVVVDEGMPYVLEVRGDEPDSVSLEGLDTVEPVDAESPAVFELLAEIPGTYPITLLEAEREIGTLEIREAR